MPTWPRQAAMTDPGCLGPGQCTAGPDGETATNVISSAVPMRTPQPTVHVTGIFPTAGPAPPGPAGTTVSWYERKSGTQEHGTQGWQTA